MAKSFEQLDVFKRAYKISLDIHKATLKMPALEQRALADQLRRASKSICANLAEGFAKQGKSKPEFMRFISMAIGSSDEMRVWLRYAVDLEYIPTSLWESWREEYFQISKMLQGLLKAQKASKKVSDN